MLRVHSRALLTEALFIAAIAVLSMGVLNTLYEVLTHSAPINWGITGRWVIMIFQGTFVTLNVSLLPSQPHEWLVGFLVHDAIAILFSATYLIICQRVLKRPASCLNALCFAWCLMLLPFFIQMPSMGVGVLAMHSPNPAAALLQTFRCHTFFGLGLSIGTLGYRSMNQKTHSV